MNHAVKLSTHDFRRMGRGIRDRYERCRSWWEPHIRCTREFVRGALPRSSRLAVLGAGRLLDLELDLLRERCEEIHLFDADPACVPEWKRQARADFGRQVVPHITDITETLDVWTREIQGVAKGQFEQTFVTLEAPSPQWSHGEFDGVISLNLLGQIPLYWRDRVLRIRGELNESEWSALVVTMGRLQRAHVRAVHEASRAWSILISDTEYYFYHVDETHWRVEPAIFDSKVREEVFDVAAIPSATKDSWLWHIAPQFIESDEEGAIHRVEARFIRR